MPRSPRDNVDPAHRLEPADLRWRCDPLQFGFETTAEITECPITIIGQPRAIDALRLGLSLRAPGYNIFVAGDVGTGRSTTVRNQLAGVQDGEPPEDLCYVHNFADPDQPKLLVFPAGRGRQFAKMMEDIIAGLGKAIPNLFDSDDYRKRRTAVGEAARKRQKECMKGYEKEVTDQGFAIVQVQEGMLMRPELVPMVAGNPVGMDQLENLVEEGQFARAEFERLRERQVQLIEHMDRLRKELRDLERDFRRELLSLDRGVASPLVEDALDEARQEFRKEGVKQYLDEVQDHILSNLDRFRVHQDPELAGTERDRVRAELEEATRPYTVNVVVDNSRSEGRPVIWETSPSYRNLFGTIEGARMPNGEWKTDHTRVKGGSFLRANGGVLVLDALDVLVEPGVWAALKRTLRNSILEVRSFDPFSVLGSIALKPAPVPVDVKVILIGTRRIYRLLYSLDEDFKKIYKVKADFALEADRSPDELKNWACFIHKKCVDDDLPPFHRDAVAAVVEHGVRIAGRQEKITTRFNEIAEVVRESGYWARQKKAPWVDAKHVDFAIQQRSRRLDMAEDLLRERIADGTVLVDLEGEKVGQVNGLAVLDIGDHVFGQPSRITAVTAMGREGIIDIERESEMSGAIHTKGVLILAGFLRSRFAQDKPLALSASLCFEQNYLEIDGDSASAAELYALLSSLSGIPIRQGIAVTGSVNQKGEVQPIGGVNEKIEGFHDLCRLKGMRGRPGVMIPRRNLCNLMLRKDVVRAVEKGRFHVWAVSTIEEGIEVLTGVPAGARGDDSYPSDSVFGRVDARLRELAEGVRRFSGPAALPG